MESLENKIKDFVRSLGVDLVGVAGPAAGQTSTQRPSLNRCKFYPERGEILCNIRHSDGCGRHLRFLLKEGEDLSQHRKNERGAADQSHRSENRKIHPIPGVQGQNGDDEYGLP